MRLGLLIEIIVPVLIIAWASLMVYGAAVSETGYGALARLDAEEARIISEVDALRDKRLWMENRASLLASSAMDPDMVDERIRGVLGYAKINDIVISRTEMTAAVAFLRGQHDQTDSVNGDAIASLHVPVPASQPVNNDDTQIYTRQAIAGISAEKAGIYQAIN